MKLRGVVFALAMGVSLAWVAGAQATVAREVEGDDVVPTGKGWGEERGPNHPEGPAPAVTIHGARINYHGGPLLVAGPTVYLIWYGNWDAGAKSILADLVQGLGGSPYFNINTTYYDANLVHVTNAVTLSGQSVDNYSHGTSLNDADVKAIVAAQNPTDPNGVYFVLTSADVNETSGFCTQYCGWHTHAAIGGLDIKYAFVGNAARCPNACTAFGAPPNTPPNGNLGADGSASVIAHELEEATTDPDLNAWFDRRGNENADKCAFKFGTTQNNGTGIFNVTLGGRDYLIQENWVNKGFGRCAIKYP